ncbi:Tad domain-containing protein [uncultured Nocardioides sp.]|uniref:Tad domain-containing protein n=1 Tax=uncultured Nocardioides sp. TaxID=198441 RepID=UPI00260ABCFC|nr:Tad domain-containing protein [uncultured Nocardioides sp.]
MSRHQRDDRGQRGSVTPLVVGFATILALGIALVTDATAAYLQRSGLSTLADGAALSGADAGATGRATYTQGVPADDLPVDAAAARAGVETYLRQVRAHQEYPGLRVSVRVDPATSSVHVRLTAPLDLPLAIPGGPDGSTVAAEGEASSTVGE